MTRSKLASFVVMFRDPAFKITGISYIDLITWYVFNNVYNKHNNILSQNWGWKALFRSYGCFFAEFLGDVSLVRLALLELNTCVGLRYGCSCNKFREFSWKMALYHLPGRGRAFLLFLELALKLVSGFFLVHFLKAQTSNPIMRDTYSSPSSHHLQKQSRNINRVSIGCGSHHSLRTD